MTRGPVRRGTQRLLLGALSAACAFAVVTLDASVAHAADDYPYAWQGQCPILPQEPIEEPTPSPSPTPSPKTPEQPTPPPPPPPVLDPVSGHLYDPRGPKPECERRVWEINGSIGDPWGFVLRNCTSFVAWRLNETNRLAFTNVVEGDPVEDGRVEDGEGQALRWSDANNWDDTARALGYRVDDVPAIGAVAQSDEGRVGHVAYVVGIGPGTVTIEEYNHATPGGYGTRTVPTETFDYLHLKDVAPSPLIGSDRPLVSLPDGHGESWTARINDAGSLKVSTPHRKARVVGPRGVFSSLAAPALARDRTGRVWIAATTRDGRVLAGAHVKRGWKLHDIAAAATTASPALTTTRRRRLAVFATSEEGTLISRERTRKGRWSTPRRVGDPESWATHTAPVTAVDTRGRAWLVALTAQGRTFAQRTTRHGWSRLTPLAGDRSSITSTPSLTLDATGVLHLHQMSSDGEIAVRSLDVSQDTLEKAWSKPVSLDGSWSPYSSPAVSKVAGDLKLAAVTDSGTVLVEPALPPVDAPADARDDTRNEAEITRRSGDATASPALVTRSNSAVYLVDTSNGGAKATLIMKPAAAVPAHLRLRASFTP